MDIPGYPTGTLQDEGYPDLRQGSCPIFSEYDMQNGTVTFELSCVRSENVESAEPMYSYRTYKNAE